MAPALSCAAGGGACTVGQPSAQPTAITSAAATAPEIGAIAQGEIGLASRYDTFIRRWPGRRRFSLRLGRFLRARGDVGRLQVDGGRLTPGPAGITRRARDLRACHRPSQIPRIWTESSRSGLLCQPGRQSTLQGLEQGIFVRRGRNRHLGCAGIADDGGNRRRNAALRQGKRRNLDAACPRRIEKGPRAAAGIMQHRLDPPGRNAVDRRRAAGASPEPSGR